MIKEENDKYEIDKITQRLKDLPIKCFKYNHSLEDKV